MEWQNMRQSGNIEDRRGSSPGFSFGGMGGGGFRTGGLGIGGLVVLLIIAWATGINPLALLTGGGESSQISSEPAAGLAPNSDTTSRMVAAVLGDTEDTWGAIFQQHGLRYPQPTLVLFNDQVDSACGYSSAAVGPFYCPRDHKVYIDLSFFRDLAQRFGAPGDFAQAYVIAHEVGHHVQNTLGSLSGGEGMSRLDANAQSVQQELQADCLAGVWGHSANGRKYLDPGDVEEGLRAAAAIGDDRLQMSTRGRVAPESFTHGSSAQRVAALRRGLESADFTGCGLSK